MDHRKDISEIATGTKRWAVMPNAKRHPTNIDRQTKSMTEKPTLRKIKRGASQLTSRHNCTTFNFTQRTKNAQTWQ